MARAKLEKYVADNPVTRLVTQMMNETDKTQFQIAQEIGLPKSNVLTMFKQGRSPLPMKHVIPLSSACGYDPRALMLACLRLYHPDALDAVEELTGMLSDREGTRTDI